MTTTGVGLPLNGSIALRLIASLRALVDVYVTEMRIAIAQQLQYRISNYFFMIGLIAEPVIYLVVWSTIADQNGGSVGGITTGQFTAYYIVWTLVRNMNIINAHGWEWLIREGNLSGMLLRPIQPITWDLGYFAGWKFVVIVLWLPIAAVLAVLFHPVVTPTPLDIAVFGVAIWGAYLVRSLFYETVGLISFWTTRSGPIFDVCLTAELLLSGRLVPLTLMPDWAQRLADVLPFKSTFYFPIEALVGNLSDQELFGGLLIQAFWIVFGSIVFRVLWRVAIRRFGAVGN